MALTTDGLTRGDESLEVAMDELWDELPVPSAIEDRAIAAVSPTAAAMPAAPQPPLARRPRRVVWAFAASAVAAIGVGASVHALRNAGDLHSGGGAPSAGVVASALPTNDSSPRPTEAPSAPPDAPTATSEDVPRAGPENYGMVVLNRRRPNEVQSGGLGAATGEWTRFARSLLPCWEEELGRDPSFKIGAVLFRVEMSPRGETTVSLGKLSESPFSSPALGCVAKAMKTVRIKPRDGAHMTLNVYVRFHTGIYTAAPPQLVIVDVERLVEGKRDDETQPRSPAAAYADVLVGTPQGSVPGYAGMVIINRDDQSDVRVGGLGAAAGEWTRLAWSVLPCWREELDRDPSFKHGHGRFRLDLDARGEAIPSLLPDAGKWSKTTLASPVLECLTKSMKTVRIQPLNGVPVTLQVEIRFRTGTDFVESEGDD